MPDYFVHESSYVDEGAVVGAGTKIWHFCHVMPGAVIGERARVREGWQAEECLWLPDASPSAPRGASRPSSAPRGASRASARLVAFDAEVWRDD